MKVKLPYVIHLIGCADEVFNDYTSCKNRMDSLYKSAGVQFNYYINSSKGHDYFHHAPTFYAKIKELRKQGIKPIPFTRLNPTDSFLTPNLRKRLKRTSAV